MILESILDAAKERSTHLPSSPAPYPGETRSLMQAIESAEGINPIIGELKCTSPTRGALRDPIEAEELATDLVLGGCIALSVITEPCFFGGSPDLLTRIRERVPVPVLRKDFILDPRQVYETRALGADAILLIARILGKDLPAYVSLACSLGLEPLVEVHDPIDARRARASGASLIGINNRDLQTMEVDIATTTRLAPLCPGATRISMSGIALPADLRSLKGSVDAFLIGTALMTAPDLPHTLEGFLSA